MTKTLLIIRRRLGFGRLITLVLLRILLLVGLIVARVLPLRLHLLLLILLLIRIAVAGRWRRGTVAGIVPVLVATKAEIAVRHCGLDDGVLFPVQLLEIDGRMKERTDDCWRRPPSMRT